MGRQGSSSGVGSASRLNPTAIAERRSLADTDVNSVVSLCD